MTISSINDRLLALETLSLESGSRALEAPQSSIDDSTAAGTPGASAAAAQAADPPQSSDIEEVLARDVWMSAARTFEIDGSPAEITQRVLRPEELDRIGAHVISFLT